jgi:putative protease
MTNQKKHPSAAELLAPAGSFEAFFAAMEAGADAVYTGLKDFSARAKAKNFTLSELQKITHYAQGEGRKLYVTLNTLVKEQELPQLVETLSALEEIGVDALIIQDLAVMRLARDHFPGLDLHSSTQMTVHNAAGVKMLERMGFSRAVLARELSLAEIAGQMFISHATVKSHCAAIYRKLETRSRRSAVARAKTMGLL